MDVLIIQRESPSLDTTENPTCFVMPPEVSESGREGAIDAVFDAEPEAVEE